ncbi:MAG: DUF3160 domain-containing protein [Patescibacteria group bacterium]|jgi:hypothetical protein
MFTEPSTILSSENETVDDSVNGEPESSPPPFKKILFLTALILAVVILGIAIFFVVKKYWPSPRQPVVNNLDLTSSTTVPVSPATTTLPNLDPIATTTVDVATSSFSNLEIEYLSFADFYKAPDNKIIPKIINYPLPLNVKIDVMNYYDISRKLNLDPGLNDLNGQGFTLINNPWPQKSPDFFALYGSLSANQIPLLITSDFIIYNYQNILKKSFKDIEKNVFYNNLWDINYRLYTAAKNRYEARLASIGNINDSILEGERLETAFFAVALELLKPAVNQTPSNSASPNLDLFTKTETDRFYFVVPPYLRDDVLAEENLIRGANASQTKSPVFLYPRDYKEFIVPPDYRTDAKLNNFYLTTKWLNSVFPLNYRDKNCPNCLLDRADWRINLTAASLISQDFSLLPELKNKWARIYKVMSFFKGLREDLSYINYRDSLSSLFGADYKIDELFSDQNKQGLSNLEKLRAKLSDLDFSVIAGGLDRNSPSFKSQSGLKVLAESFWPNDYIFSRLTAPTVSTYLGTSTLSTNITSCKKNQSTVRCTGFSLDPINLVYPIGGSLYFAENTNYLHYNQEISNLQAKMSKDNVKYTNNYWTTLNLIKIFLSPDKNLLPVFALSPEWRNKELKTAAAVWINLQLPLENFSVVPTFTGTNINSLTQLNKNSYVEPNLNLINELIANNNMLLGMFNALQLDTEVPAASQNIKNFSSNLIALQQIVTKELAGESLTTTDNETIVGFTRQFKITNYSPGNQQLYLSFPQTKNGLKEDLSQLQLLVLIHQEGNNKVFSVGPAWSYQEGR